MLSCRPPFLAARLLAGCVVTFVTLVAAQDAATRPPPTQAPNPTWQPKKPTTQPASEPAIQALFNDLAASDAAVRGRALSALLELTRADLPGLRNVVERLRPVAPSQAGALRDVVTHVYLTGETYDCEPTIGFLGLVLPALDSVEVPRPEPQPGLEDNGLPARASTGVPIDYRIPGFCAFGALRDGDVVLGVVHPVSRRMRDWMELTRGIQSFPAGEQITLEVLRQGTVLNILVTLDAKPLLPNENVWTNVMLPARETASAAYWSEHFAPLVDERMSEVSLTAPR